MGRHTIAGFLALLIGVLGIVLASSSRISASLRVLCAIIGLFALLLALLRFWYWTAFLRRGSRERRSRKRDASTPSPLEQAIAAQLDARGIAYEREYAISRIHVDFAFPSKKLAIECDGYRYHHDSVEKDEARDEFLRSRGWKVLRLSGTQIRENPSRCAELIVRELGA